MILRCLSVIFFLTGMHNLYGEMFTQFDMLKTYSCTFAQAPSLHIFLLHACTSSQGLYLVQAGVNKHRLEGMDSCVDKSQIIYFLCSEKCLAANILWGTVKV